MTRLKLILIVLFLPILICVEAQSIQNIGIQNYTTEWIKVEKGLSQNTVFTILQDSDGFLWIGTWDGLNKFDGYNFTFFRPNKSNIGFSLSNETIKCLYEDEDGLLWIGTENGLNRMNRYNYSIEIFNHKPEDMFSICSDTINFITGNKDGILYIGTNNGLSIFDKRTNHFTSFYELKEQDNSLCCNAINCLFLDSAAFLWIGTNNGLSILDLVSGQISSFSKHDINPLILSDSIFSIAKDLNGQIWLGTGKGISIIGREQNKITFFRHNPDIPTSLNNDIVTAVYTDKAGNIWIGTYGGGINFYQYESQTFSQITNIQGRISSLSNNFIHAITEDCFGNIWVAAWKGLNRLELNKNNFNHIYQIPEKQNTLSNNIVWDIFEDNDSSLWIATEDGISIYDRRNDEFRFMKNEPSNPNTINSNQTRTIFEDSEGLYWIGTLNNGLSCYNKETGQFVHYKHEPNNPNSLANNQIWSIIEDHHKNLWIGTFSGLSHFNRREKKITNYYHSPENKNSIPNNYILNLYFDSHNWLWISTYDGLAIYDIDNNIFQRFFSNEQNKNGLTNNRIFSVMQDSKGFYWIATMGGGLNKFDIRNNSFKAYTTDDGLANNIIYNILEDNQGDLWISTNNGLSYFNTVTETFINYDISDGIQSSEFNLGAACKTLNGEIAFGGMNGFNIFLPELFTIKTQNPNVVITSFKIFENTMARQYKNNDTIILKHHENFFSFEFASLELSQSKKNKYAYKLEGFNKDWIYGDANSRIAEYTNVPPGNYIFRVRATNNTGGWSEKEVAILLIIKQAWYKTWWFFSLLTILFISIAVSIAVDRYQKIRNKHRLDKKMLAYEKQVFQLRQKALSAQMNPHFIFNTLNAIQNFILKNNTDKAILYMGKLSQLMRLILNSTSDTFIPVIDEVKVITHYLELEKIRFDNKFDYSINIDESIDSDFAGIPPMILQPFVENALLHGILQKDDKGKIIIQIKNYNSCNLVCIIEDDGIGREKAFQIKKESGMLHRSRGINITTDRLNLFDKLEEGTSRLIFTDIKDKNDKACGTKVEIILPFIEL
ncbi:MAG: two-component regulator propeller domain-containing protein [Bacteroidales bacterium]|nr:two-component regulator propeller domain-containing protein [Bacteroidales bacterium]